MTAPAEVVPSARDAGEDPKLDVFIIGRFEVTVNGFRDRFPVDWGFITTLAR